MEVGERRRIRGRHIGSCSSFCEECLLPLGDEQSKEEESVKGNEYCIWCNLLDSCTNCQLLINTIFSFSFSFIYHVHVCTLYVGKILMNPIRSSH